MKIDIIFDMQNAELDLGSRRVIEIIQKDPNVLSVIPEKPDMELRKLVGQHDFALHGEGASTVRADIDYLVQYIEGPVITDTFKDHEDRRAWRYKMATECGEQGLDFDGFYDKNQLRRNRLSIAFMNMSDLTEFGVALPIDIIREVDEIGSAISTQTRITNQNGEIIATDFSSLTLDQKTELVQGVLQGAMYDPYSPLSNDAKLAVVGKVKNVARKVITTVCALR